MLGISWNLKVPGMHFSLGLLAGFSHYNRDASCHWDPWEQFNAMVQPYKSDKNRRWNTILGLLFLRAPEMLDWFFLFFLLPQMASCCPFLQDVNVAHVMDRSQMSGRRHICQVAACPAGAWEQGSLSQMYLFPHPFLLYLLPLFEVPVVVPGARCLPHLPRRTGKVEGWGWRWFACQLSKMYCSYSEGCLGSSYHS